jgi:uncharacterized membrane protein
MGWVRFIVFSAQGIRFVRLVDTGWDDNILDRGRGGSVQRSPTGIFRDSQAIPGRVARIRRSNNACHLCSRSIVKLLAILFESLVLYVGLCAATFLMLRMALDYTAFRDDVDFLRFKQAYVGYWWWKTAFYVHVFSAVAALSAGFTQFSVSFLRRRRRWHRLIGRIYAYDILVINFPAGMVLAVCANGLLPGRIAFVLLDWLWFTFTLIAVAAVRNGQIARHREFMIRSYALTFSAITLRTWKLILSHSFHIDAIHLYMIEAWMGFVPNLIVAEWWIRTRVPRRPAAGTRPGSLAIAQT